MSILLKETLDRLDNKVTSSVSSLNDDTSIWFVSDPGKEDREFGPNGGLAWTGDEDQEYIFGTSWLDKLIGGYGSDKIYGFEGNDLIYGEDVLGAM